MFGCFIQFDYLFVNNILLTILIQFQFFSLMLFKMWIYKIYLCY